jgi:hypothetical protein
MRAFEVGPMTSSLAHSPVLVHDVAVSTSRPRRRFTVAYKQQMLEEPGAVSSPAPAAAAPSPSRPIRRPSKRSPCSCDSDPRSYGARRVRALVNRTFTKTASRNGGRAFTKWGTEQPADRATCATAPSSVTLLCNHNFTMRESVSRADDTAPRTKVFDWLLNAGTIALLAVPHG